jgi:predicted ATPase
VHESDLRIVTGAPGTGKTAILDVLGRDMRCTAEPAREILAEQRAIQGTGTPDRDPSLFMDLLLRRSIEKYEEARRREGVAVFDRGIPDCVAYAAVLGVDPTPSLLAVGKHRYAREVFFFEPWKDIYETDDERVMSFADVIDFHQELVHAYERAGYALLRVPQDSIENRVAFVRSFVADAGMSH